MLSKEIWRELGRAILESLAFEFQLDVAELLISWQRVNSVIKGCSSLSGVSTPVDSLSQLGEPSDLAGGGEGEAIGFQTAPDPPLLSQVAETGDGFSPEGAWLDSQPSSEISNGSEDELASESSGEAASPPSGAGSSAVPVSPAPALGEGESGGECPSLCAFPALGGGAEPLARAIVTTLCPHCGISTRYPPGTATVQLEVSSAASERAAASSTAGSLAGVEETDAGSVSAEPGPGDLTDLAESPRAGESTPHASEWGGPALGFRAIGETLLDATLPLILFYVKACSPKPLCFILICTGDIHYSLFQPSLLWILFIPCSYKALPYSSVPAI